jgi:hypothetical protein
MLTGKSITSLYHTITILLTIANNLRISISTIVITKLKATYPNVKPAENIHQGGS